MPRGPRLDVLGLVHHVMSRGIEGRLVFVDETDREGFLGRLGEVVEWSGARLYAWCLMGNHFHLLVRPTKEKLSSIMRRLMTGHAVSFNRRHGRRGHLFQNRYKSIVVEEDAYFVELVRYIHLNPVRAGLIRTLDDLDRYPYTGHAVLMEARTFEAQDVEGVLRWFGERLGQARTRYREFVAAGLEEGVREEFRGGGLIRSGGGVDAVMTRRPEEREAADERVLGSGPFVEEVLALAEGEERRQGAEVAAVLREVSELTGVGEPLILGQTRKPEVVRARELFLLRAHEEAGWSFAALARLCGLGATGVRAAVQRARGRVEAEG